MKNKLYKYFLLSFSIVLFGFIYFQMLYSNQITIKKESSKAQHQSGQLKSEINPEKEPREKKNHGANTKKSASEAEIKSKAEKREWPEEAKIDLNTATKEELMTLKGIGSKKAELILQFRKENGPFSRIEEIMRIKGIKQKAFDKIKDRIKVSVN